MFIKQEGWRLELQIFLTARHFVQVACIIHKNIWYCFVALLASCSGRYTLCVCLKTFFVAFADWLPENGQAAQWNIRRKRLVNSSSCTGMLSLELMYFQEVFARFQVFPSQRRYWALQRWSISSMLPLKARLYFWMSFSQHYLLITFSVCCGFGVYGDERAQWVTRSRLLLNHIHL